MGKKTKPEENHIFKPPESPHFQTAADTPATGYSKKNFGHPLRSPHQRYQRVDAMKTQHPIRSLCQALEVSTSGYYDWRHRQTRPGPRARENAQLLELIIHLH